jgi:glycerol uptake facilitator-like aquaporin
MKKLIGEFLGTLTLVAIVVGSGIMATSISQDVGVQLLINTISTVFGLLVLIQIFAPISGANFNPVVTNG